MGEVLFNVYCNAVYKTRLDVPKEIEDDKEATLKYLREHLDECSVEEINWISDKTPEEAIELDDLEDEYTELD